MRFYCLKRKREIHVPDGVWVAQFECHNYTSWKSESHEASALPPSVRVTKYKIKEKLPGSNDDFDKIETFVFTAGVPFAVLVEGICTQTEDNLDAWIEWTAGFIPARMLVEGKPKTLPHVRRLPEFVRGAKQWRWTRLSELSEIVELPPEETFLRYFPYCGKLRWSDNWIRDFMPITLDEPKSDITYVDRNLEREKTDWRSEAEKVDTSKVWVSAGWAMDVCLMHKYGVVPEINIEDEE